MWLSDHQKFGVGFCVASVCFFLLGLSLFFDRACLSMANILLLVGVTLLMGPQRTLSFFMRREKYRGTACFLLGIGLILARWTIIGFAVELYGVLALFGDFLGVVVGFVGSVPVVGPYVEGPLRRITGAAQQLPV
ncbi:vesicle transport protein [Geopyxis carbonaria]|nr:vesicle transport protein [Geopyxis carbonaria]